MCVQIGKADTLSWSSPHFSPFFPFLTQEWDCVYLFYLWYSIHFQVILLSFIFSSCIYSSVQKSETRISRISFKSRNQGSTPRNALRFCCPCLLGAALVPSIQEEPGGNLPGWVLQTPEPEACCEGKSTSLSSLKHSCLHPFSGEVIKTFFSMVAITSNLS